MKSISKALALAAACTLPAHGQAPDFNSGSDGSDGALDVTESTTLILPPDGVLNYTTITIASGATLRIGRNGLNTPVYLLATGDVSIAGTIDVSGSDGTNSAGGFGGPGGWSGGSPGLQNNPAGDGQGPGGGKVGTTNSFQNSERERFSGGGSYASAPSSNYGSNFSGNTYGSALLIPLMGGSGGAGSVGTTSSGLIVGGGGGGGAILIASNSKITVTGTINARGGASVPPSLGDSTHPGSGGAIRLVAPLIDGNGDLQANGGGQWYGDRAGYGRIRLDTSLYSGSFRMDHAASTTGYNPVIFPANPPSLRLKNVAGTEIAPDNQTAIIVTLPANGSSLQPVTVEASNFKGEVKFVVSLVPERGPTIFMEGSLPDSGGAIATRTVNVNFPLNASSQVYVWTKQMTAAAPAP